jgi:Flp pilus assembly protein TadG
MIGCLQARLLAGAARLWKRSAARRLLRQQDGATTVEFALVVLPFLAVLFAIIQTAVVFYAGQVLETAAASSARLVMTGQAQKAGYNQSTYRTAVCNQLSGLISCNGSLAVDVRTYTQFSKINTALPVDSSGNLNNDFTYQPGGPGDIVVVRLMYKWPMYVSLLGLGLSNMSGNNRLLVSTVAFRNEPYQ